MATDEFGGLSVSQEMLHYRGGKSGVVKHVLQTGISNGLIDVRSTIDNCLNIFESECLALMM